MNSLTPAEAYLSTLAPVSRTTMAGCLDRLARLLAGESPSDKAATATRDNTDWWNLTTDDADRLVAAVKAQRWEPATVNKHLTALRQVFKAAWRQQRIDADQLSRLVDFKGDAGSREPAGREIPAMERDALLAACDDDTPIGARDAALIAVLYATGLRRAEVVSLNMGDWNAVERSLRVVGKRNKQRTVYVALDAVPWLEKWLRVRGVSAGPLFCPVYKGGHVAKRRLSSQTVWAVLDNRSPQGEPGKRAKPHDFRRTMVGDLLDADVDLVTVQKIAGHVSPLTTAAYDRRSERARRDAVDRLSIRPPST